MSSVTFFLFVLAFFVGLLTGGFLTTLLSETKTPQKAPAKKPRIMTGQVWFMPNVGRCVVSNVFRALGEISLWVGQGVNKRMIHVDLTQFEEEAVLLALGEGCEEKPIPTEYLPHEEVVQMLEQGKSKGKIRS